MLQDTSTVDVAIVGAGIIGAAAAASLAAEGATVAVFEGEAVAAGASGRNLGTVLHPLDAALAPLLDPSLTAYRKLAAALPSRFGLPTEPVGLLMLDRDRASVKARADEVLARFPELRSQVVDASALESALAPDLHGCLLHTAYPAEPASATAAFAELAQRAGARFEIGAEAAVTVTNGRATGVTVGGETVTAGKVLVAAGHKTPAVVDPSGSWKPISPLWGVTVQVEIDGPAPMLALSELFPDDEEAAAAMFNLTTSRASDGTLVTALGATFSPHEPDPQAFVSAILRRGSRFVPALADARVKAVRCCARPVSRDGAPLLGPIPGVKGLHVASGHGAWGISLGPASAEIAVEALLGRAEVPAAYAAARFSQ